MTHWFTLRPDASAIRFFSKPCVSLFADFIIAEYPHLYNKAEFEDLQSRIWENKSHVGAYVCFSEYVRRRHLADLFDIGQEKSVVVPHGYFDYAKMTRLDVIKPSMDLVRDHLRKSPNIIRDPVQERQLGRLLQNFPFEEVTYLLVSTKNRPHKNLLFVVKALHILLRKYIDIKLILTAAIDFSDRQEVVASYIVDNGLQMDCLSINRVPAAAHAALYAGAAMTIHPSRFEGGLPFTVAQSLSMGTPILLARGPTTREFLPPEHDDLFCFDATSPEQLAQRILEVLADRAAVRSRQLSALPSIYKYGAESSWNRILEVIERTSAPTLPELRSRYMITARPGQNAELAHDEILLSRNGHFGLAYTQHDAIGILDERGHVLRELFSGSDSLEGYRLRVSPKDEIGVRLVLQADGNLVLYEADSPRWHSASFRTLGIYSLTMSNDGAATIVDEEEGHVIWSSHSSEGQEVSR